MIKNRPNKVINLMITDPKVNSSRKITGRVIKEKIERLTHVNTI